MHLSDLGDRICILGPSNSGKSTLADAIARKRGLTPVHLDQLFHVPNTDWVERPYEDFAALHDQAILGERWVMDGNYSKVMPQRLARATGFILLEVSTAVSLMRYFRRCLFERDRRGALEGGRDSIKWGMIRHIAITTPKNRLRYETLFQEIMLPKIRLGSASEISRIYDRWELDR
ncbi:AAA family ATPase [Rhizobium oryzicola]|uniref:AAA family ATPase n=1 Tax=Rhizobium oryzicola TaxID=1232668 RepID=A0ABT8T1J2_9HYPH|nr:AAA family ATPase [Rhizobium oryzicola]MDO1584582.1 AAA family ATPase [Rhizobium oryzicola]